MYGRGVDPLMFIMIISMFMTPVYLVAFQAITSDKIDINIENDYLLEYNQCKIDLENTQPICPACECKSDSSWWSWDYFAGFVMGAIVFMLINQYEKYKEKNTKKTKSRKKGS